MAARAEFFRILTPFGAGDRALDAAWDEVATRYGEAHRAYHNLAHIEALLALLADYRPALTEPDEIALAVLYHDVVYHPTRSDNEAASAALASSQLLALGVSPACIARVAFLIDMTRHGAAAPPAGDSDLAWFLDFDLATLAANAETYDRYAAAIRREYAFVPATAYREGRVRVLSGFLAQPSIFRTPELRARWEAPARANLAREIAILIAS